jgi:hypothetical protein
MFEKETPMNFPLFPLFFVSIACAAIAISMIRCHFASFFIVVAIVLLAGPALTLLHPPRYRICGRLCNEAEFVGVT